MMVCTIPWICSKSKKWSSKCESKKFPWIFFKCVFDEIWYNIDFSFFFLLFSSRFGLYGEDIFADCVNVLRRRRKKNSVCCSFSIQHIKVSNSFCDYDINPSILISHFNSLTLADDYSVWWCLSRYNTQKAAEDGETQHQNHTKSILCEGDLRCKSLKRISAKYHHLNKLEL